MAEDGPRETEQRPVEVIPVPPQGSGPADPPIIPGHLRARFDRFRDLIGAPDSRAAPASGPSAGTGASDPSPPKFIGRYRIDGTLGRGGFGEVFLGWDDELMRPVAIKVPRKGRVARRGDPEAYLDEARAVAELDHPNIVPVYDAGRTDDGLVFIVSKVIAGRTLADSAGRFRSDYAAIAGVIAAVADALHHAHGRGLVHRDVKPANILIDGSGKPFLTDFGLVLRDEDFGWGPVFAGTPAYMSPEQARREGHRVDGRTDIFSLGIVFYQLLTNRHPYGTGGREALVERIATSEARPPRQVDEAIPKELERICLRALAARLADRYSTARDFADDLRAFASGNAGRTHVAPAGSAGDDPPIRLIPKGLRSFDAGDADFFLDLLHGPRDRDGVPEAIRFWKARIEPGSADDPFPFGLIYGPSGCGKSSLVKAGLLPRLAPSVTPVYVEAVGGFEDGLLRQVRRCCPGLDPSLGLVEALAEIRMGATPGPRAKVLLVLDQFEQWLHANPGDRGAGLIQALRHCDGRRLQALAVVRDDFWMATSRFMRGLEVRLVEGHNAAAVDLFTPSHARRVLAAFGRAYGALPEAPRAIGPDRLAFLGLAVSVLAQGGMVSPIRLALFAELVKAREWTPSTVKALGGSVGIGVRFLEERFSAPSAPPGHRLHEAAVRSALAAVLPAPGEDIKGHARPGSALREAVGYAGRGEDFDDLIRILDRETRLLTPIASEGESPSYQLTHDYLVPSIREWLDRKQKETRRGRAALTLAERASLWRSKPERRQLPSLTEWAAIRALTRARDWTGPQRAMMRAAARHHLAVAAAASLVAATIGLGVLAVLGRLDEERLSSQARGLVRGLLDSKIAQAPAIVRALQGDRPRAQPLLREALADPSADADRRLRARLALLETDPLQASPLLEDLLRADPEAFAIIRESLLPHREWIAGRLWDELESPDRAAARRFRAAAALARYAPGDARWAAHPRFVAEQLIAQPSLLVPGWAEALRPVGDRLAGALADRVRDRSRGEGRDRVLAAEIFADYASDRPDLLTDLLADADPREFAAIFARLRSHAEGVSSLEAMMTTRGGPSASPEAEARRKAVAAITLLRMGRPESLWPLLKADPDPRLRCLLIHWLAPMGADPGLLIDRLRHEPDASARAAILLTLGDYSPTDLPPSRRADLEPSLASSYRDHPSAEVHAASGWLLRSWGRGDLLGSIDRELAGGQPGDRGWYHNPMGQAMVAIPGPVQFQMGAPRSDPWRKLFEAQRWVRITRPYDLSATEVTVAQFRPFLEGATDMLGLSYYAEQLKNPPDTPFVFLGWYDAARYCNWLSAREGIPRDQWCFAPNDAGEYADGMRIAENYADKVGYRLPTEPEWEYACRAGTVTDRSFGETDALMADYARSVLNSADRIGPSGALRPNPFGLFDLHGNAFEWCMEPYGAVADQADGGGEIVRDSTPRVTRGGTFLNHPRHIRSAARKNDVPRFRDYTSGMRIARSRPARPGA